MDERERIVAWLRREAADCEENEPYERHAYNRAAKAIQGGEHMKRPEPTIPASQWIKTPGVGH